MADTKLHRETLQILKLMTGETAAKTFAPGQLPKAAAVMKATKNARTLATELIVVAFRYLQLKNVRGAAQLLALAAYVLGAKGVSDLLEQSGLGKTAKKLLSEGKTASHAVADALKPSKTAKKKPSGVSLKGGSSRRK